MWNVNTFAWGNMIAHVHLHYHFEGKTWNRQVKRVFRWSGKGAFRQEMFHFWVCRKSNVPCSLFFLFRNRMCVSVCSIIMMSVWFGLRWSYLLRWVTLVILGTMWYKRVRLLISWSSELWPFLVLRKDWRNVKYVGIWLKYDGCKEENVRKLVSLS